MLNTVLWIALFLLGPALLLWAERRSRWIAWLGAVVFAYLLGIVLGNVFRPDPALIQLVMQVAVVPAIPMLLLSADMRAWLRLAPHTVLSLLLYLASVLVMALVAGWLFRTWVPDQHRWAAALSASIYIGGTANMGAIYGAIGAPASLVSELTLIDLMLGGPFLLVVLAVRQRLLLYLLPPFRPAAAAQGPIAAPVAWQTLGLAHRVRNVVYTLLLGIAILGGVAGLVWLLWGSLQEIPLLIGLTLGGLLCSRIGPVRRLPGSYETGQYLFLIFCLAAGTLADVRFLFEGGSWLIALVATVAFGGILLHTLLATLFRLDADTVLITQVAGFYGPPFIAPVAAAMHNREILVSGLTLSVINLTLGNFAGLLVYAVLT
ncbi:MAG: hypothetical protein OHK0039_39570 [Bacteroidia bacterium]